MKTQKYLVTVEMPDGDMISPGWIQELIQDDCDVEDKGRQKVLVEEIKSEADLEIRKRIEELANDWHHKGFASDEDCPLCMQDLMDILWHFYELGRKQVLQEIYDGKTKPVDKITAAWLDD